MPTATSATELEPLVTAQGASRAALTAQALGVTTKAVRDFDGWYDSQKITRWAAALATSVEALLKLLANQTDAYAARSVAGASGRGFRPIGAVGVDDLRTGITHAGAFARAADVYRFQQSRFDGFARDLDAAGVPTDLLPPSWIDPIEAALTRALEVVDQDTSLVVQQQAAATFQAAEKRDLITGWTRVIHPELSETGTCGLCIAAATRIYRVDELMPIHGRCKCVPAAVRGDYAPGLKLNDDDLKRVYSDAGGSTSAASLKKTRYRVDQHGNLGPVLVAAGSKPPRERRLNKGRADRAPKTIEQTRADIQRVLDQQRAIVPKADALNKADPKKWGPYFHKLEDRIAGLEQQLASSD